MNNKFSYIWGYKVKVDGKYLTLDKARKFLFRRYYKIIKPELKDSGVYIGSKKFEVETGYLLAFEQDGHLHFFGNKKGLKSLRWRYLKEKKFKKLSKTKIFKSEIKNNKIIEVIDEFGFAPGSKMDDRLDDQIPKEWITETKELLKSKIDSKFQNRIFLPENEPESSIYAAYYSTPDKQQALHIMAAMFFSWLDIEGKGCVIDFYDQSIIEQHGGADSAGLYTRSDIEGKETEVIFINSNIRNNGTEVAAVLCHEIMHLYLHRIGLELDDVQENELLTDLATIELGFGLPVLNGMSYKNSWWLSIILIFVGFMYWKSEEKAFGYFKSRQYSRLVSEYLKQNNISVRKIYGYLTPGGKHFFGWKPFQRSEYKPKFFKILSRRQGYKWILQIGAVVIAIAFFSWIGWFDDSSSSTTSSSPQSSALEAQINTCQKQVSNMETSLNSKEVQLNRYETDLDRYDASGEVYLYNQTVDRYNSLLNTYKIEYSTYSAAIDNCNALVDQYNN